MKKTLTAICAAILLLGCLLSLPTGAEAAKTSTSATTSKKVRITKQPASASVFTGSKIKVKVTAKGTGLKYKWYYKDKGAKSYKADKSVTGSTYNRKMTSAMNGRKIYCKITDKYGNTVKSKTVTLKAMVKAKITTQPKSVKVYVGDKATVKVKAVGDQRIYKWYYKDKGAKSYKLDKTITGSTYNRVMTKAMNGRQVYCKITDQYGNTVKTKAVTITVRTKVQITKQPASTAVYSGEYASVKLKATGTGLSYTWYYKNAGASSFKKVTSMKGTTYKTKMSAATDGRQVYCLVKDKYGNKVKTKTVTLSTMTKAAITKQPVSAGVYVGATVPVTVAAIGDGLTYKWLYKDTGVSYFQTDSSCKGSAYNRVMTASMNGRQIFCRVTDQYGNTADSNKVTLTVKNKATITTQPANDSVYVGEAATVAVKATGDGLSYKWYYKDASTSSFKQDTGITGSSYDRAMTKAMNGRKVYCKVTDKYGNSVTTKTVTITVKNKAAITKQPANVSAYVGSNFSVSVGATGDGITYKWYWRTSSTSGWQEGKVTTMVEGMTGWQVRCRVTDQYGNYVDSNPATLTAKVKATITMQPVKATVLEGSNAKFTVAAKGDGIIYQWEYKDGSKWASGATGNAYTFATTAAMDGRQVRCKVTDKYGNTVTSETVTLNVGITAAILKQPQDMKVTLWEPVTISFEAKGDGLTYEWYIRDKDALGSQNTKIDVTDATYTFDMTIETVGRRICCIITDAYGNKAVTNTITVTADIPATILKQPVSVHGALGQKVELTITAAGDGANCVWEEKAPGWTGFQVTSQIGSTYYIPSLTQSYDGVEVRCKVTDKYGNAVYSDTVVISTKPYYINYYGPEGKEDIFCVELLGKEFATTDLVDWSFTQVGKNDDGTPYGFAKENIIQAEASVRGLDFGDGTYLTKYVNVTEEDVQTLIGYMQQEGYTVNSESTLNPEGKLEGDVSATTLVGAESNCTITFVKTLNEMYVTASKTMVYSPLLQQENFSTQSQRIEGAETKLYMLPADTGDCYVIQLKNGNFIVFDGDNSKTLPTILDFLKTNTPEDKIPVVEAWFITHGHYDHCSWTHSVDASFADKVRVEGVYFNQTSDQIINQTVYSWRGDTATTGWRDRNSNPWPARVRPAVERMKTSTGETTKMYRQQTGQIYYFCGLQVEIAYCQEQINFCDYQMDLNASSTWHLVRSEEGNTFLDAGDTENVNMEHVANMYSSEYDVYKENLDIMSVFHHGHNLYAAYRNFFRAPILFLPSAGPRTVNAEATTVYSYFTTKTGTNYRNRIYSDKTKRWSSSYYLKDGLGLPVYHYGDGTYIYNFATNAVTKYS